MIIFHIILGSRWVTIDLLKQNFAGTEYFTLSSIFPFLIMYLVICVQRQKCYILIYPFIYLFMKATSETARKVLEAFHALRRQKVFNDIVFSLE
jgi:hypothetical protein